MKSLVRRVGKAALLVAGVLGLAVAVAVGLTDSNPSTLPLRVRRWLADRARRPPVARPTPPSAPVAESVPLFSDITFDDSGYATAIRFSRPITNPASLAEVAASVRGRARRGVAYLEEKLAALSPGDPATPSKATDIHLLIGSLEMSEGDWARADQHFAAAQTADPARSAEFRANAEALRGIASLRRGEIENCVACCNEASCIFPLSAAAIHRQTAGSRGAIDHFARYLHERPDDLGVRWLLNVACMTLGEYPDGVPPGFLLPLGRMESPGNDPRRMRNIASRVGLNAPGEAMAGGCLVEDYDNDGRLDVLMPTTDVDRGALLFRNRGDGTFEENSREAGLADQMLSLNGCQADYDNDGRIDVLLLRGAWEVPRRMSLLRNVGGRFEDVTTAAGLGEPIASQAAAWADYDNDGRLDLYVAGEFEATRPDPRNRGRLYHNRGNGTFEEVATRAGVANDRYGKGVAWGDYDDDGHPDLYVANLGQPGRLYHNRGDGTFEDLAPILRVTEPSFAFACWFWDYDNDGRLDLWINPNRATLSEAIRDQLGQPTTGDRPRLYRNTGGMDPFQDVTAEVGLDRVVLPMGSNFGDIDNDGFLDIYLATGRPSFAYLMPNRLFRNAEGRRFEDITGATGTGHLQKGHGVAIADWDRDGDQDIFVEAGGAVPGDRAHNVLFENPGNGNHWLTVRLVGTRTNRSAIGARIRVDLPSPDGTVVSRYRTVGTTSSFGGNPLACTIGLGSARRVGALEIQWPTSRSRQVFHDIAANASIEITEDRDEIRVQEAPPIRQKIPH